MQDGRKREKRDRIEDQLRGETLGLYGLVETQSSHPSLKDTLGQVESGREGNVKEEEWGGASV